MATENSLFHNASIKFAQTWLERDEVDKASLYDMQEHHHYRGKDVPGGDYFSLQRTDILQYRLPNEWAIFTERRKFRIAVTDERGYINMSEGELSSIALHALEATVLARSAFIYGALSQGKASVENSVRGANDAAEKFLEDLKNGDEPMPDRSLLTAKLPLAIRKYYDNDKAYSLPFLKGPYLGTLALTVAALDEQAEVINRAQQVLRDKRFPPMKKV